VNGTLPRALKEMMFVAISKDRDCKYCEAAHAACCRMLGVDATTIQQIRSRTDELQPARKREVIRFAVKCARTPQELSWPCTRISLPMPRGSRTTTCSILTLVARLLVAADRRQAAVRVLSEGAPAAPAVIASELRRMGADADAAEVAALARRGR
jgi:AhpD family alkylhydroperoxidase